MIKDIIVSEMVFVEQTTYYAYRNEAERLEDKPMSITSSKATFNNWIKNAQLNPNSITTPLGLLK